MNDVDLTSDNKSEKMRQKINTVGKPGSSGEQLRNIIAVQMITEGWDARNVTHIMGLRAFSSQLLCEQTVGRGLRRMAYEINPKTNLFDPEYVNIFGVPFTFLPHEGGIGSPPQPPQPTTLIEADPSKHTHEIAWPNVDRINLTYTPVLSVDWERIRALELEAGKTSTTVSMAQVLGGKPHLDKMSDIDLYEQNKNIRMQRIIFLAAKDLYNDISRFWVGNRDFLIPQIIKLVEQFMKLNKIKILGIPKEDMLKTRMTILFNMQSIVTYVSKAIKEKNIVRRYIVLNPLVPIKSSSMMRPWHTKKHVEYAEKNHINLAVYDSSWEIATGNEAERNKNVLSWIKNDHIGFVIKYSYNGHIHDYYPDFLIKLVNNTTLVLEIKGRDDEQNRTKRTHLKEWVDAVNEDGNFGTWAYDVAFNQTEVKGIIEKHLKTNVAANIIIRCPSCKKVARQRADIEEKFGFRNMDGITRPQSWCRECRNKPEGRNSTN